MKRRLIELLRCPVTGEELEPYVIQESREIEAPPAVSAPFERFKKGRASEHGGWESAYGLEIESGFLVGKNEGHVYPVISGVPRLIRNAYDEYADFFHEHRAVLEANAKTASTMSERLRADAANFDRRSNESFTLQWKEYQYEDKTWFKDDLALRRREFLTSMDLKEGDVHGSLILDAGCGNGKLTSSVAKFGAEIVGMDLSRSIDRANAYRAEFAGEQACFVHFVQGNVLEAPFVAEAFDHVHSSGVLHHTPSTERAFKSLLPLIKPKGKIYVQLYRRREAWVRIPNNLLRKVTTRLPVGVLYKLCYAMVPLHTLLVQVVAFFRREKSPIGAASRRERAVSLFDHFSPRYQFRYRPEEVRAMFEGASLRNVKDVTLENEARHMVAFVGEK